MKYREIHRHTERKHTPQSCIAILSDSYPDNITNKRKRKVEIETERKKDGRKTGIRPVIT